MSEHTPTGQESADNEPLTVEEIALESTREILRDRHRQADELVNEIAGGLYLMIEDGEHITVDKPTAGDVEIAAAHLYDLAEFLQTRVVPLVED